MEILSSRILLRAEDPQASQRFFRDVLGLAVYREFGSPEHPGMVFFLGNGFLEVSGHPESGGGGGGGARGATGTVLWLQVRDIEAEHERLRKAGATITREPRQEPWGLVEMWLDGPDGVRIVVVEIPEDHPLRRDQR
ncbi:VOC family protein [Arthrobacter monumenti]